MSYDRKHKLEYHLASTHNKIDTKLPQDQEIMLQPKNEYFQEVRRYILFFNLRICMKKSFSYLFHAHNNKRTTDSVTKCSQFFTCGQNVPK